MNINRISQMELDDLGHHKINTVIVSSGYESRARYVAEQLHQIKRKSASRMVAWGFVENSNEHVRKKNDQILNSLGYKFEQVSGKSTGGIEENFKKELLKIRGKKTRIVIDMTSMTRAWYGAIVRTLAHESRDGTIITDFIYVPAKWTGMPSEYPPNEILSPVKGFSSRALPNKPTALIIGLGYDQERAIGLNAHLDPNKTLLFYAKPGVDKRFESEVLKANRDLLKLIPRANIFTYSISDCVATFKNLESVVGGLLRGWRPVLCSTGPKLFSLMCFLLASYYKDISVWRVSAGSKELPVDHKPGGKPVVFEVEWGRTMKRG